MTALLLLATASQAQEGPRELRNVYSRPNDDTFQNRTGNAGEPYEVGRMTVRLLADEEPKRKTLRLRFRWETIMVTGRHVEAGAFFILRESRNSLLGENEEREPGLRKTENATDIATKYPPGVTVDSPIEKKVGSVLSAELTLGEVERDGTYSGNLQLRRKDTSNAKPTDGLTQLSDNSGPPKGIFKNIAWTVTVEDGRLKSGDVSIRRFNVKQPLRLIESNYQRVDATKPEHVPYPKQAAAAKCKDETVGAGDITTKETLGGELERALAKAVVAAGCLDCHSEGNPDNFRFCDDGRPIRAAEDFRNLYAMATNFDAVNWKKYPAPMKRSMQRLKEFDEETKLLSAWALNAKEKSKEARVPTKTVVGGATPLAPTEVAKPAPAEPKRTIEVAKLPPPPGGLALDTAPRAPSLPPALPPPPLQEDPINDGDDQGT